VLGDALWTKAIHHYVRKHRSTNVTTPDFQRAITEATGRNLDWLFDQYVYRGGHPALKIAFEWDDAGKRAKLTVQQTQDEKDGPPFRLPVGIDFTVDGKLHRFDVEINERMHNFFFSLPDKPDMARLDHGHNFLKSVEFKRGKEMLRYQLEHDDDVVGRIDAARELSKIGSQDAVDALKQAVLKDSFWGVQAEAARALGAMRSQIALDALLTCTKVRHPKARRGVMAALGQFRDERAADALIAVLRKGDPSYFVEGAAAQALGQTRSNRAYDVLAKVAMKKESMNDVIRSSALLGMTDLKDERALPIAIEWTRRGKSNPVRGVAASTLGKLGLLNDRARDQAYDRLVELLSDEWLRVRLNAVTALGELKEMKAVGELGRTIDRDLDGRVIRFAREAIARLREGADKGEEIRKLRDDLDKLSEENRAMKDRLDKVEASANGAKPATKRTRTGGGAAKRPKPRVVSVNGRRPARQRVAATRSQRS
jgi:aminopeptidase N